MLTIKLNGLSRVLEFYLYITTMLRVYLPQGPLCEVENPRNDHVGELFDAHIVDVYAVVVELAPVGKVVVHGEYWDARSVGGTVAVGNQVRVVTVSDRSLDVAALDDSAEGSS